MLKFQKENVVKIHTGKLWVFQETLSLGSNTLINFFIIFQETLLFGRHFHSELQSIYSYRTWPTSPSDWRHRERSQCAQNPDSSRRFQTDPAVFNNGSQSLKKTCVGATKNRFTQLENIFLTNPSTNSLFTTSDISM